MEFFRDQTSVLTLPVGDNNKWPIFSLQVSWEHRPRQWAMVAPPFKSGLWVISYCRPTCMAPISSVFLFAASRFGGDIQRWCWNPVFFWFQLSTWPNLSGNLFEFFHRSRYLFCSPLSKIIFCGIERSWISIGYSWMSWITSFQYSLPRFANKKCCSKQPKSWLHGDPKLMTGFVIL